MKARVLEVVGYCYAQVKFGFWPFWRTITTYCRWKRPYEYSALFFIDHDFCAQPSKLEALKSMKIFSNRPIKSRKIVWEGQVGNL